MTNRNAYFEFSKIYKRVMDIELSLKDSFYNALHIVAPDKKFFRLIPYLSGVSFMTNLSKYNYAKIKKSGKKVVRNKINDIISSAEDDNTKIHKFLKLVYLADLLKIITDYSMIYKDKKFCRTMFLKKEPLNNLKSHASKLVSLRNIIMHFNISDYYMNKTKYLETLNFWETVLDCNNNFIHHIPELKPTIKNILNQIEIFQPNILKENDRIIVDVFDDIAFIKGLSTDDLPQYWSIIRQLYEVKSK